EVGLKILFQLAANVFFFVATIEHVNCQRVIQSRKSLQRLIRQSVQLFFREIERFIKPRAEVIDGDDQNQAQSDQSAHVHAVFCGLHRQKLEIKLVIHDERKKECADGNRKRYPEIADPPAQDQPRHK